MINRATTARIIRNLACEIFFVLLAVSCAEDGHAQILGTGNPNAPYLPFTYLPALQGEARVTAMYISVTGGNEIVRAPNQAAQVWGLKDNLNLVQPALFLDTMVRFALGPICARVHYEPRAFRGVGSLAGQEVRVSSRFEYSGVRLGGDIDLYRYDGSRIGLDFDYDLYFPTLTQGVPNPREGIPPPGHAIQGEAAMTLGVHADYKPRFSYYGMNPLFDANFRWPLLGTEVTDFRVGAGVQFPQTVLGIWALKIGYRKTSLIFRDSSGQVDMSMGGIFGELAYYY